MGTFPPALSPVLRLAAIDMHGSSGTARRKRSVQAEFTAALAAMLALGIWLAIGASGPGTRILGIWLAGAGVNYAPLAAYALVLGRPGALEAEPASPLGLAAENLLNGTRASCGCRPDHCHGASRRPARIRAAVMTAAT
jgi:hypothetical protein